MKNKTISMDSKLYQFHNFSKANLVTNLDGTDIYVCADCGLKGKRFGVDESIVLVRPSKIKLSKCDGIKGEFIVEEPKKIESTLVGTQVIVISDINLGAFGVSNGDTLNVVEYPKKQEQGLSGIWVEGNKETYGEPFRLVPGEYEEIKA